MTESRYRDKTFWLSSSLIAFIFVSFVVPWDALSRFFLFFISFPVLLSFVFNGRSGRLSVDPIILGAIFVVLASVAINFALDLPVDDSMQSVRWGVTTVGFILCVYISSKMWRSHSIGYSSVFFGIVLLVSVITLSLYVFEGKYPSRIQGFGFMSHPIVGPAGLICLWGAGMSLLISSRNIVNKSWFLSVIALIALLLVVFLSQSRGPLISLFIYLIALMVVVALHVGLGRRAFIRFSALFSGLIIVVMTSGIPLVDSMIERGGSHRSEIFLAVISEPPESVLLGSGSAADFSSTPAGTALKDTIGLSIEHPHNVILNVYYQSGILVLIVFLILIAGLINRIISNSSSAYSIASGLSFFALMLLLNASDGSRIVAPPSSDWMFFWFPFAFLCGFYSKATKCDDSK